MMSLSKKIAYGVKIRLDISTRTVAMCTALGVRSAMFHASKTWLLTKLNFQHKDVAMRAKPELKDLDLIFREKWLLGLDIWSVGCSLNSI